METVINPTESAPVVDTDVQNGPVSSTREVRDGVILEKETFRKDTTLEGFHFYKKSFANYEDAKNHFDKIAPTGKTGESTLIGMINDRLAALARSNATAQFAGDTMSKDIEEARIEEKFEIISADDAYNYFPGVRDARSLSGIEKKINNELAELAELRKTEANDSEVVSTKKQVIKDLLAQRKEILEAVEKKNMALLEGV